MDRFGPTGKSFEKTGPPFEVDHFSRSDRLEFWLNGSRPSLAFPNMVISGGKGASQKWRNILIERKVWKGLACVPSI